MNKKNLKTASMILAAVNLAFLFIFNYGTVSVGGFGLGQISGFGVSFWEATNANMLLWLLPLIPAGIIILSFVGESLGKNEGIVFLSLPVVGLLLHIILLFVTKGRTTAGTLGLGGINAASGFYLVLLTYLVMIVVHLLASKDTDLGNEGLNSFVKKVAEPLSNSVEKVTNKDDNNKDDNNNA